MIAKKISPQVKLVECPRDAMQGWSTFIPTLKKTEYLNSLLQVGFDTLDCGSFVSPKAIPQMSDTKEVLKGLDLNDSKTKLLVIAANKRGAEEAVAFDEITYIGFPFSVSPTFQMLNTNSTILESLTRVEDIQQLCVKHNKKLVVYLSMAFGNPYGDDYNEDVLIEWADKLYDIQVRHLSLADTVGLAVPEQITTATGTLINKYPEAEIGVHLHSTATNWKEKMDAAFKAGCLRFDGALKGIGGCPMANSALVGNMNTEWMISYLDDLQIPLSLNRKGLNVSLDLAEEIFMDNKAVLE